MNKKQGIPKPYSIILYYDFQRCFSKGVRLRLINKLKLEWKGQQYDLLRHNCCHFAVTWSILTPVTDSKDKAFKPLWISYLIYPDIFLSISNCLSGFQPTLVIPQNGDRHQDALCLSLGVGPVPNWVTSLAGVGAMLRSNIRNTFEDVAAAARSHVLFGFFGARGR